MLRAVHEDSGWFLGCYPSMHVPLVPGIAAGYFLVYYTDLSFLAVAMWGVTSGVVVCYTYAIAAVAQFWLEHSPVTREVAGSSPVRSAERMPGIYQYLATCAHTVYHCCVPNQGGDDATFRRSVAGYVRYIHIWMWRASKDLQGCTWWCC